MTIRHFLKLADFTADELNHMLERALWITKQQTARTQYRPIEGKVL